MCIRDRFQKVAYSRKWNHFQEDFIKYLDSKYKKKFLKRLYNLYEFLRKEFFSNDNSLQHLTEGNKITIDSNSVKKWAADLRKLTKAYKSIGDSEDDPATLKQYDKIRRAFATFGNNFEKWVYKFFLQYNWQGSRQGETWEAKEVREKAWVAVTSLMGNFPEAWDYVEKKHKPSPQLLVRYREKTIRRYRTAFREGINKAQPVLLEPMMKVEVVTPEEYMGDVIGDLNSRRGQVQEMTTRGNANIVNAQVPLANMFGYCLLYTSPSPRDATLSRMACCA